MAPHLSQVQSSSAPKLRTPKRVEVARAKESCGTLQERHFAHAGVTSQVPLRGALEPLNVALPLPALRTLRLYLLLADNERRTGSGGDGACKGQWPDIQRGAGRKAHGESEQESEHERQTDSESPDLVPESVESANGVNHRTLEFHAS